jgi:hypothetical protein
MLKNPFRSGDYETMNRVVAVRASKDATKKAGALVEFAIECAESGMNPQEAMARLRAMGASANEADLALGLLRLEYFPFELRDASTAWRYLVALKHSRDIAPLTTQQEIDIERVESLVDSDPELAFEQLKILEPRLVNLQQQVSRECDQWDGHDVDHDGFLKIDQMLGAYLGPESSQSDFLLQSRYAFHTARMYLIDFAGLLDEI